MYAIRIVSESRRAARLGGYACAKLPGPRLVSDLGAVCSRKPSRRIWCTGAFFPCRECLQNCWMNRYGLLRCFSLAGTHHSVHDGACDVHCPLSKVDVSPLQSEQLALSQPGGGRKEH